MAVSADGKRSYIIDPDMVSPDGWENDKHIYVDTAKANNVYKVSIKDFQQIHHQVRHQMANTVHLQKKVQL